MNIIQRPVSDYIQGVSEKDTALSHYTAGGTLSGAIAELSKPDTVNVCFMNDHNGDIVQLFPLKYWAYHTGVNNKPDRNGNRKQWCKESWGIENVNWGQLTPQNGLYLPYTMETKKAVPAERVVWCKPFGTYQGGYYEILTPKQIASLEWLIYEYLMVQSELLRSITHADINSNKRDFPPDFPGIPRFAPTGEKYHGIEYGPYKKKKAINANPTIITPDPKAFDKYAAIRNGEEMRYTVAQLLERGDVIMGEYTRIMGALKVINMGGAK